jgi:hypothetical protein
MTREIGEGKTKFVQLSEEFELTEFELSIVNYYKRQYQIQGELDLVRVSEEFELINEFELARENECVLKENGA